jgi:hypothetical protein
MDSWVFILLFHNLLIDTPIGNDYIVIVPTSDPRIEGLKNRSPAFCRLIDNFVDQFQRPVHPSLLLLRRDINPDSELLRAFRNALALCSIFKAWENILGGNQHTINDYVRFSNYFDFYPYTLSKDEKWIIVDTTTHRGINEAQCFSGQLSPELVITHTVEHFYDKTLFHAILEQWTNRYIRKLRGKYSTALFRSLEMAYRASASPQLHMYDFGVQLGLWVSAFEILTYPKNKHASVGQVIDHLHEMSFNDNKIRRKLYKVKVPEGKNPTRKVTLIAKTYHEMNCCRNDFLHGNPVRYNRLFSAENRKYNFLIDCAALIYKCALIVSLKPKKMLNHEQIIFATKDKETKEISKTMPQWMYQTDLERALLRIRKPR